MSGTVDAGAVTDPGSFSAFGVGLDGTITVTCHWDRDAINPPGFNAKGYVRIGSNDPDEDRVRVEFTCLVEPPNDPPIVHARGPYAGVEGARIQMEGSASDPDGDTLTVDWTADPDAGVDRPVGYPCCRAFRQGLVSLLPIW